MKVLKVSVSHIEVFDMSFYVIHYEDGSITSTKMIEDTDIKLITFNAETLRNEVNVFLPGQEEHDLLMHNHKYWLDYGGQLN